MISSAKLVAIFFLITLWLQAWGTADDQKFGVKLLLKDTGHVLSSPARWDGKDWFFFSLASGVVAATMGFGDEPLFTDIQSNREGGRVDAFSFIEPFGFQYAYGMIGGLFFVGSVFDKPRALLVARDGLAASLIGLGLVGAMKTATGRSRPVRKVGAFEFDPFSGEKSFPSGHSANAFALATVITSHYHPAWLKIGAYSLAGLVGLSRIDHNEHFISDVVAGALLGTAIGYQIVRFNRKEDHAEAQKNVFLLPYYGEKGKGISMTIVF